MKPELSKKVNISVEDIDELNLLCYETIADEYGDETHETCRDFDKGTEFFLLEAINNPICSSLPKGFNYLDVGVGTGVSVQVLMNWLTEMNAQVDVLDISKKMLEITEKKFGNKIDNYIHTSIHKFESNKKYDLIVASLCDPYLTESSIKVYKNILKEDGILLLTLPTNTWAKSVRKENIQQTTFHDKHGNKYISYSFCWSKSDLIKLVESNGLYNYSSRVILVEEIKEKKPKIGKINNALLSKGRRIPMLLTLIFLNRPS